MYELVLERILGGNYVAPKFWQQFPYFGRGRLLRVDPSCEVQSSFSGPIEREITGVLLGTQEEGGGEGGWWTGKGIRGDWNPAGGGG
jgi:hypothetical protein